jgi:hypothetical protein
MTTFNNIPQNPFVGEAGVRIEKAVRRAIETGHIISVGDVLIELRMDATVSDDDFRAFFRALLDERTRPEVERWVVSLVNNVHAQLVGRVGQSFNC